MTPPKVLGAAKPTSSVMMSRMLGACLGGTTRGAHHAFDCRALSLITPPNFGSGGGSCLPLIVVVALGDPSASVTAGAGACEVVAVSFAAEGRRDRRINWAEDVDAKLNSNTTAKAAASGLRQVRTQQIKLRNLMGRFSIGKGNNTTVLRQNLDGRPPKRRVTKASTTSDNQIPNAHCRCFAANENRVQSRKQGTMRSSRIGVG